MKSFFRSFLPSKTGQVDTNDDSMECLNTCLRQVKPCMSLDRTQHAETKFDPRPNGGFLLFQISILNYYIQYMALVWYVPRSRITLNVLLFWPPNTYLSKISWINFWKKLLVQTTNFFSTIDSADYLLCTEIVFDIQNNFCIQHVLPKDLPEYIAWYILTYFVFVQFLNKSIKFIHKRQKV